MLGSENGYYQVVELLLKEHADVNHQMQDGVTALILASQNGHYQVVELLLKEHADVNHQRQDGATALMLASQNGYYQVVELLLKEHVDVNYQAQNGIAALMLASENGHYQVVDLLKVYAPTSQSPFSKIKDKFTKSFIRIKLWMATSYISIKSKFQRDQTPKGPTTQTLTESQISHETVTKKSLISQHPFHLQDSGASLIAEQSV